jgi:hypothetical protein
LCYVELNLFRSAKKNQYTCIPKGTSYTYIVSHFHRLYIKLNIYWEHSQHPDYVSHTHIHTQYKRSFCFVSNHSIICRVWLINCFLFAHITKKDYNNNVFLLDSEKATYRITKLGSNAAERGINKNQLIDCGHVSIRLQDHKVSKYI